MPKRPASEIIVHDQSRKVPQGQHRQDAEGNILAFAQGRPDTRSDRSGRRRGRDHECDALDVPGNHFTLRKEAAREIERDGPLSRRRDRIEQGSEIEQEVSTLTSF